jgi:8-oxo-dGTP diphosphatase
MFGLITEATAAGVQRVAAAVLVVNHAGEVLLVRRAATTLMGGLWELPGGGVEDAESLLEAAQRELSEETGLTTARFTAYLGHADYVNARGRRVREFTFAATLDQDTPVRLSDEHDSFQWLLPADLPAHVTDRERDVIGRHTAQPAQQAGFRPLPAYLASIPAAPLWAGIFFTTRAGEAILLRAADPTKGLQFPGGDAEFTDLSPLHTAVRETFEETGIRLLPESDLLPALATVVDRPRAGWPTKIGFLYSGGTLTDAQFTKIQLDPREHTAVVALAEADLEDRGERHALTRAALGALRSGVPVQVLR